MPALLFLAAAWKSRTDVLREGEATLLNAVVVLGDAIRDRLPTEELALVAVADHLHGLDWGDIARPATSDFLVKLNASVNEVSAIWIADRSGAIAKGLRAYNAPAEKTALPARGPMKCARASHQ